jgi:hypothetical protein
MEAKMFVINPAKLKKQTIALIVLIASGTFGVQVEWVQRHIAPLVSSHPHLSFLTAGIIGVLSLIHNPVAQKVAKQVFIDELTTNADGSTEQKTLAETTTPPATK